MAKPPPQKPDRNGDDVPDAWAECPRGVWALELALRAGVSNTLLARAVERTAGEMPAGLERKGELLVASARFERSEVPGDAWLLLAQAVFHDAVDATPEVARTRQARPGWPIEIEALLGSVVELGALTVTPTPHISAVYACAGLLAHTLDAAHAKLSIRRG